jgi:tight adherence protein B
MKAYTLLPIALLALSFAALKARRTALRREKAASILSANGVADHRSISSLTKMLWERDEPPLTRRGRFFLFAFLGMAAYILTRNPVIALLPWPLLTFARRTLASRKRKQSLMRKEEQVMELIDSLNQSLRSGLSLRQSLEAALEDTVDDMRGDILEIVRDLRLGSGLEEALSSAAESSTLPSLKLTYSTLALLYGKGGDLPRALERLRGRVSEGLEARREARTLTSQSRASGYLVSSLPVVFLGLQALLNPRSLSMLLSTPVGNLIMATALGLNAAAFFLIRKIVNLES